MQKYITSRLTFWFLQTLLQQSIEAVITGEKGLSVVADESTINHWKQWFRALVDYFLGCLISIAARFERCCERQIRAFRVLAPKDLVLRRGWSRLAGQELSVGGKHKLLALDPFCIPVRLMDR